MCGIAFAVRPCSIPNDKTTSSLDLVPASVASSEIWDAVVNAVQPRGPDLSCTLIRHAAFANTLTSFELRFHASVLHMRGITPTLQPFESPVGDILLWNGEIFNGLDIAVDSNDGATLFAALQDGPANPSYFLTVLRPVEGPYAFVYYQAATQSLFFGRDGLGRRSLLVHPPTSESPFWLLASNAPPSAYQTLSQWTDVPCNGVHCISLSQLEAGSVIGKDITMYRRYALEDGSILLPDSLTYLFSRVNTTAPSSDLPIPSPAVPPIPSLAQAEAMSSLRSALLESIKHRISPVPLLSTATSPDPARIAVLFSGGIDCTTMALLAADVLEETESIDLINVAFENPRSLRGQSNSKKVVVEEEETLKAKQATMYDVPDRLTGRASYQELCRLRPNRKFHFVECNVPYAEMLECRQTVIDLMRPNRTVMDLSISLAFYFAARGRGVLVDPQGISTPYESYARVLLSGLGADELLGGYARHRRAFYTPSSSSGNWENLIQELQMDIDRIPVRNLGRDDRIISIHGKEARYPFLAANVVDLCTTLPIEVKCDFRWGEGVGDKMLLRLLAKQLGLSEAAGLKKRAIHFGARTAKMDLSSGKDKGDALLE